MTLNGYFALKTVFGSTSNGFGVFWLSDKIVWKLAELRIYFLRQKCSPGNAVSGSIRFMQIFAGVPWGGGEKFYIHCHTTAFTWCECRWPGRYFKVIRQFHIKFLKNGVWYGKSYYRLLIGSHTLAYNWCHFWWPWSIFEGHFSQVVISTSISAIFGGLSRRTVPRR